MVMSSTCRRRGALPAVVVLLLVVEGSATAQRARAQKREAADVPEAVEWRPGPYADLLREAGDRNVPVLVSFLPREPSRHARVRLGLFQSAEFREVSARCVPIVAMDADHPSAGGDPTAPCPFFPTIRCGDHVQMARTLFPIFAENGVIYPPVHLVLKPTGELQERIENSAKQEQEPERDEKIVRAACEASKAAGPGLDRGEYGKRIAQLREADTALSQDDFAKAWGLLQCIREEVEIGALPDRAAVAEEAVCKRAGEVLDWADRQVDAGEIAAAYDTFRQIEAAFKKTPLGSRAQKERGRLERGKDTGPIIRAHKIALEAEDLLRKAEACEAQGDVGRALRVYEQILERYADTPAAENARIRVKTLRGQADR